MLPVHYQITLGSSTYIPKDKSCLIDLQAIASLSVPVNHCRVVLGNPVGLTVKPQDPVTIKLGYGTTTEVVFTGTVGEVEWDIDRVTIYAIGAFQALTAARFNLLYEKPNAGDIVKDVAQSRLKLKMDKVESGLRFAVYALGDRTSAYDHLQAIANQCGFDLYANSQDKVVFALYKAATTHKLTYGIDILSLTLAQPTESVTSIEVYGESPSSQGQGDQAYSWLTKKEVKGSAGTKSGVMLRLADPTARTQDLAGKIAKSILAIKQQKSRGQVKVLGDAKLKLGDGIEIAKMPLSQQNGSFKITGVTHRLNRQQGFYTTIDWEEA
jgi:hypothetical protein